MAKGRILASDLYAQDLKQEIADITKLLDDQKVKFEQLKKEGKNLLQNTKKLNSTNKQHQERLQNVSQSANILNKSQKELQSSQRKLERQRQRALQQIAKQENAERELINASKMQVKSLDDLKTRTNALNKLRNRLDTSTKQGRKEFKRLTKEINTNTNALKRNDAQIGRFQRNVGNYTSALKGFGSSLGIFVGGAAVVSGLKNAARTMSDFEKAIDGVQAITGATANEIERLEQNALRLGSTTSRTSKQVADLQTEFAKLGFSTSEILDATEATIQLSIAAGTELGEAAVVAASTVRGFGLEADETQRVVDVMAKSFSSSALDISKFSTAMAIAAPVARNAGVSIERTTAIIGKVSDAGVDASTAGTALRNVFLELAKQGLTFDEAMNKINSSTNKNATAMELFGKRGATVASIIAENVEEIDKFEKSLNNATGAAEEMASTMEDNLQGDVDKLKSAWEGLTLSFSEGNNVLRDTVQWLTKVTTGVKDAKRGTEIYLEATGRRWVSFGNVIRDIFQDYDQVSDLIINVDDQFKLLSESLDAGAIITYIQELKRMQSTFNENKSIGRDQIAVTDLYIQKLEELLKTTGGYEKSTKEVNEIVENKDKTLKETIPTINSAEIAYNRLQKRINELNTAYGKVFKTIRDENGDIQSVEFDIFPTLEDGLELDLEDEIDQELKNINEKLRNFYKTAKNDVKDFHEEQNRFIIESIEEGLVSIVNSIGNGLSALSQIQAQAAQERLDASQSNIDSLNQQLENELEAQRLGQANYVDLYRERINEEEKIRERAAASLEKAQKREAQIQLLSQAQSITTAVAKAIEGFSSIPIVGVVLGLAAAASIIAAFASYKAQIKSQTRGFAEGTEYLERDGEPKGKDTIPIMADEGERIISTKENKLIPKSIKNRDIPYLVKKGLEADIYKGGLQGGASDLHVFSDNNELIREMQEIKKSNNDLRKFFMHEKKDIIPLSNGHVLKQEGNGKWTEYNSIKDAIA